MSAHNIPVYMYHHVADKHDSLTVTAANFEQQIKGLASNGYKSLTADQFADFLASKPTPKKSVLITFDDGYLDNWVYAHPVLKKYGMSAILFAVTGLIGDGLVRPNNQENTNLPEIPGHHQSKEIMFSSNPDPVMLRWSEIEAMLQAGTFEIHSHTHTHKRWDLSQPQKKNDLILQDLQQSRDTLQKYLGHVSSHLCWPQGYFDDDYKDIAKNLGFTYLYTTDARGQNTAHTDSSHIYRFAVRDRKYGWLKQRTWLATHKTLGPIYNQWKARSDLKK